MPAAEAPRKQPTLSLQVGESYAFRKDTPLTTVSQLGGGGFGNEQESVFPGGYSFTIRAIQAGERRGSAVYVLANNEKPGEIRYVALEASTLAGFTGSVTSEKREGKSMPGAERLERPLQFRSGDKTEEKRKLILGISKISEATREKARNMDSEMKESSSPLSFETVKPGTKLYARAVREIEVSVSEGTGSQKIVFSQGDVIEVFDATETRSHSSGGKPRLKIVCKATKNVHVGEKSAWRSDPGGRNWEGKTVFEKQYADREVTFTLPAEELAKTFSLDTRGTNTLDSMSEKRAAQLLSERGEMRASDSPDDMVIGVRSAVTKVAESPFKPQKAKKAESGGRYWDNRDGRGIWRNF